MTLAARGQGRQDARPRGGRSASRPPQDKERAIDIAAFQRQMRDLYGERDAARGLARSFAWFTEECGELSRALFRGTPEEQAHELADVLAWLASLAEQAGIDLAAAAQRYADGCPRCGAIPCACAVVR